MFCTTLRKRPSFSSIVDRLSSSPDRSLKGKKHSSRPQSHEIDNSTEHQLNTHDLSLVLSTTIHPQTKLTLTTRSLRVLLLSASCTLSEQALEHALHRITTFSSLDETRDRIVVFLLNPPLDTSFRSAKQHDQVTSTTDHGGIQAFTILQTKLFSSPHFPRGIPLLPLNGVENLPKLLKTYIDTYKIAPPPSPPPTMQQAINLLRLCTAALTPMSEQTAYILMDVFGDLRSLMRACKAAEELMPNPRNLIPNDLSSSSEMDGEKDFFARLRGLVDEQECRDLIDFWREEWAVE